MAKFVSGISDRYWNPAVMSMVKEPFKLDDGTYEVVFFIAGEKEDQRELFDDRKDAVEFFNALIGYEEITA